MRAIQFAVAGTFNWTPEEECVLVRVSSSATTIVSFDPTLTYAGYTTSPTPRIDEQLVFIGGNYPTLGVAELSWPLSKGQTVYVAPSGGALVTFVVSSAEELAAMKLIFS